MKWLCLWLWGLIAWGCAEKAWESSRNEKGAPEAVQDKRSSEELKPGPRVKKIVPEKQPSMEVALSRQVDRLRQCPAMPMLLTSTQVMLSANAQCQVQSVRLLPSRALSPELMDCLRKELKAWKFPASKEVAPRWVHFRVELQGKEL